LNPVAFSNIVTFGSAEISGFTVSGSCSPITTIGLSSGGRSVIIPELNNVDVLMLKVSAVQSFIANKFLKSFS